MIKSIILQFFNQNKIINNSSSIINRLSSWINGNPILFLWGVWLCYFFLDIAAITILGEKISSFYDMSINFFGGGIINQYWFFVFLPNLIFKRQWLLETVFLILLVAGFLCLKIKFDFSIVMEYSLIRLFLIIEFSRLLHFLILTSSLWGFHVNAELQKQKNEMEVHLERIKIEHKALQLSPHFVLNMFTQYLSAILGLSKSLYYDVSKFTLVLGYSYKSLDRINYLAHEVSAMESYIGCQRQRFGKGLNLIYILNPASFPLNQFPIPKLTLMTLLENMFKHGDCFDEKNPCLVIFKLTPSFLGSTIFTCHLHNSTRNTEIIPSTEFGISSVIRILDYYFSDHFQLFTTKNESEFNLFLTITYHENFTNWTN